jgi:hypothetical protein
MLHENGGYIEESKKGKSESTLSLAVQKCGLRPSMAARRECISLRARVASRGDSALHQRKFPAGSACFSMPRAVSGKESLTNWAARVSRSARRRVVPTGFTHHKHSFPALPCRAFTCRRFAAGLWVLPTASLRLTFRSRVRATPFLHRERPGCAGAGGTRRRWSAARIER